MGAASINEYMRNVLSEGMVSQPGLEPRSRTEPWSLWTVQRSWQTRVCVPWPQLGDAGVNEFEIISWFLRVPFEVYVSAGDGIFVNHRAVDVQQLDPNPELDARARTVPASARKCYTMAKPAPTPPAPAV